MKNFTILLMLGALIAGCASDTKKTPDYYAGPESDASITTDNATDIVELASGMQTLQYGFLFAAFGKPQSYDEFPKSAISGRASITLPFDGDCGGSGKYTVTDTSFTIVFSNYCSGTGENQSTKNGTLKWTVTDEQTDDIDYTLDITTVRGTATIKTYGTMKTLTTDNGFKMTYNYSQSNSETNESFKLEDYVMEISDSSDYFSLSGKMCSSDIDGCITINTVTPFVLTPPNYAGEMTITAGTSVISVKVNDSGQCDVVATIDGVDSAVDTGACYLYLF